MLDDADYERLNTLIRAVVREEVRAIVDERIGALEKRLTPRIAALEKDVAAIKSDVAELKQRMITLEARTDNLVRQVAEVRSSVETLSTRLRDTNAQLKMLGDNIRQAYGTTQDQEDRLDSLETLMRRFMSQQPPTASPGS